MHKTNERKIFKKKKGKKIKHSAERFLYFITQKYILYTKYKWLLHCNKNVYLTRNWKNSYLLHRYIVVQSLSCIQIFATLWTTAWQSSPSFTISQNLFKLMSIELMMPSNHLILFPPSPFTFSLFPASGSIPVSQLFTSGGQVLELQLQHQSMQWILRVNFL